MADDKKTSVNPEQKEGLTLVLLRNIFYRDNYTSAAFAVMIVLFIDVILAVSIVHRYFNPPEPQYFATNSSYQLVKYHPLSDPVVNNNYVLQWVTNAVRESFSLDFIHWREQLQRASNNFTSAGWNFFLDAYKKSGDLQTLVNLKMVASAQVTGSPVVQYQGVLDGRYVWKVQIPIIITYTNVQKSIPQPLKVTVIVVRVPVQDNPDRIAINEFLPETEA